MKKIPLSRKLIRGLLLTFLFYSSPVPAQKEGSSREYYQLTVYHFKDTANERTIDNYLQNALLPALHKTDINKVGVFKAIANDTATDKLIYVLIPIKSLEQFTKLSNKLDADAAYQTAGKDYLDVNYTTPAYTRMETIILHAFPLAPNMQMPPFKSPHKDRVYELRSYESASEKLHINKVGMFNKGGEVALFKRLGFNAVFYAQVIAGSRMPNLMYMTTFENMQEREAHWKAFSDDASWKELSAMPQYQNNVSHIDITFLRPAEYSDY